jgi:hypothetical protein
MQIEMLFRIGQQNTSPTWGCSQLSHTLSSLPTSEEQPRFLPPPPGMIRRTTLEKTGKRLEERMTTRH